MFARIRSDCTDRAEPRRSPGRSRGTAGRGEATGPGGVGAHGSDPACWPAWFQVSDADADADAALDDATGLGASVLMAVHNSPFGRMGIPAAPQRAAFGIIDIAQSPTSRDTGRPVRGSPDCAVFGVPDRANGEAIVTTVATAAPLPGTNAAVGRVVPIESFGTTPRGYAPILS
ncbi:hypothetical protein [Nocardia carnea]|uniref:hypothetical protein n=1 Tax=Nocardia carnea TaxID=37328 RepID=UPI002458B364|nr:hypothetical protein [Nocardia carnea]